MSSAYYELLKGIETRLKAGIPLRDALEGLEADGRGALAALAGALRSQIEAGATLAQALGDLPVSAPSAHAALVDAGESSGRLDETLADIIAEENILADARRRLQLRLAYPLLICCLAFLLPFLYLVFQGRTIEYLLIQACFFGPLGALLLLVFFRHRFFPRGSGPRLLFEHIVLVVPFFGRLAEEYALAGSLQLLGRLLQAGLGYADGRLSAKPPACSGFRCNSRRWPPGSRTEPAHPRGSAASRGFPWSCARGWPQAMFPERWTRP